MPFVKQRSKVQTGVYTIYNLANGKRYIGSTSRSFAVRFKEYRKSLPFGKCWNRYLQRAWDKYGAKAFKFVIIEVCSPEDCVTREQHWLDLYDCADPAKGYNLSPTAGSNLGLKWDDVSREKKAAANRRQFSDPEERKKYSDAANKRWRDPEQRRMLALKNTGKKHTQQTKDKMSESHKQRYLGLAEKAKTSEATRLSWIKRRQQVKETTE